MRGQTVFCPECRHNVKYSVQKGKESAELKGETYSFESRTAYCKRCHGEVYVAEIEDANLKALYDVYRKEHDLISLEDIRAIPEKYGIGKRPLSLLLGWGEQTFSRYYNGDMPTKQYSDTLRQINADPSYYRSLLEKGKGNLKSMVAYERSKIVTEKLLRGSTQWRSKMDLAVNYLLAQCRDITPLSLQKALYYTQGFFYAFHNDFLFTEDCEAWMHGPVYRTIYNRYKDYCFNPIDGVAEFDVSVLSGEERVLLDSVIRHICCYSGKTLEAFTHMETPWVSARRGLPADAPSNNIIPKASIGAHFTAVKEKYRMLAPANIKDYTDAMFRQI